MDVSAFPLGRRTDAPTRQRRQKDSKYPQEATRFSKGDAADNGVSKAALPRADISTVTLGFSPSFGSSPVASPWRTRRWQRQRSPVHPTIPPSECQIASNSDPFQEIRKIAIVLAIKVRNKGTRWPCLDGLLYFSSSRSLPGLLASPGSR